MESNSVETCDKPCVYPNRLQLKKNNVGSMNKKNEVSENKLLDEKTIASNKETVHVSNVSTSLSSDTSMTDFKSPKIKKNANQIKVISNKPMTKRKKKGSLKSKLSTKKPEQTVKLLQNQEDVSSDNNEQPQIKSSSELKDKCQSTENSDNIKIAHVCPLCFKTFKDSDSQALHMKSCAAKNKISTKKLLDAVQLQERQAAERKSLGLLAAPILQEKKQTTSRKSVLSEDSELQLALALSRSLHEAEQLNEWGETEIMQLTDLDSSLSTAKSTLQSFGFTTNKPVIECSSKSRKKHLIRPTVLETRSQEERNRLITDKIAEILMENDMFTQKPEEETDCCNVKQRIKLKRHFLQEHREIENTLWEKASLIWDQKDAYVTSISQQVFVTEERENLDRKNVEDNCIYEWNGKKIFENEIDENTVEQKFINTVIRDWGNALNVSFASDLIIRVEDDKHIWAHKLVLYIRCPNVLLDIVPNDDVSYSVKEIIHWDNTSYCAALAFLEFIYCGSIKKHTEIFNDENALTSVRILARRYKAKEVFEYLRMKETTLTRLKTEPNSDMKEAIACKIEKQPSDQISKTTVSEDVKSVNHDTTYKDTEFELKLPIDQTLEISDELCRMNNDQQEEKELFLKIDDKLNRSVTENRESSASPDLFDDQSVSSDIAAESKNSTIKKSNKESEDSNLNILLSLVAKDTDTVHNSQLSPVISVNEDTNSPKCTKRRSILNDLPDTVQSSTDYSCENTITTTPKSRKSERVEAVKQRNDISLFIERFRQENMELTLDGEIESTLEAGNKSKRNSLVNLNDTSPLYIKYSKDSKIQKKAEKKSSGLSMLERDVKSDAANNPNLYDIVAYRNDKDTNESDCSQLYRSDESATENSLNSTIPHNSIIVDDNSKDNKNAKSFRLSHFESVESVSDFETDISMYTKYKRKRRNNSIAKYRTALKKHTSNTSISNSPSKKSPKETENNERNDIDRLSQEVTDMNKTLNIETDVLNSSAVKSYENIDINISAEFRTFMNDNSNNLKDLSNSSAIVVSSNSESDTTDNLFHSESLNDNNENIAKVNESEISNRILYDKHKEQLSSSNSSPSSELEECFAATTWEEITQKANSTNRLQPKSTTENDLCKTTHDNENKDKYKHLSSYYDGNDSENSTEYVISDKNVTPPPDYENMATPELHKELKKYGLKSQKRSKAVKLLTYIYNELHPLVPVTEKIQAVDVLSSEDEGPPRKKINQGVNSQLKEQGVTICNNDNNYDYENSDDHHYTPLSQLSNASIHSEKSVTAGTVQSDESVDLTDVKDIKEAFTQLLKTDKRLHTEILLYKPINIELLSATLKSKGLKHKQNALMDLLDEQCITFNAKDNVN